MVSMIQNILELTTTLVPLLTFGLKVITVSRFLREWNQFLFLTLILPYLSPNFPREAFQASPVKPGQMHPMVYPKFLPPAYAHILTRAAFGDPIPEVFAPGDPDNYECSHRCEASMFCINPLHLTVEKHRANLARQACKQVSTEGCGCKNPIRCID